MAGVDGISAFAGEPQPVEVHHRGAWWSGDLLGWRFEADGRCVARVRCVVDGLRHSAWVELSDLRLPERIRRVRTPELPAVGFDPALLPRHAPAVERARHRPTDDETQPHLLLAGACPGRPSPGGLPLPASRGLQPGVGEPLSPV